MDTSEQYRRMADCEEIQLLKEITPYRFGFTDDHANKSVVAFTEDNDFLFERENGEIIWLPRQDQLQKMLDDQSSYPVSHQLLRIEEFFKTIDWWEGKDGDHGEITWEQLWLAFTMLELHSKKWDGDKWAIA